VQNNCRIVAKNCKILGGLSNCADKFLVGFSNSAKQKQKCLEDFSSSGKCIEEVGGRIFHDSGLYLRTKPLKVSQQEQAACLPYPPQSSTLRKKN
jgi:hypothetical protein